MCERGYIWNPATCSFKNGKYVRNTIDFSVITCDEIIEKTKAIPTKSTSTKTVLTKCTSTNFYTLIAILLITIALLIAVSIYCFFTEYREKQKSLLPCRYIIIKLKETGY